jgi:hypothetical protein
MNNGGRIVLLGSAVVLLLVGVVCLRQRLGRGDAPPAFVPGSASDGSTGGSANQPTILSADPRTELENAQPNPWREPSAHPSAVPRSALQPTFPINADHPPSAQPQIISPPTYPSPVPPGTPELRGIPQTTFPSPADAGPQAAQAKSFPRGGDQQPVVHAPRDGVRPHCIITRTNDSLWMISERAYGVGLYYRALFAFNRDRVARPDRIEPGIELVTPPVDQLRRLYPDLCPAAGNPGS